MIEKTSNSGRFKEYKIIKKIGQGSFGSVFKVMNINNNKYFALKQIILDGKENEEIEQIKIEANILLLLNSDHIVKYYDSFIEENTFNIIMELCEGLDLSKLLNEHKIKNQPLDLKTIYGIIKDLCLGLKEIHSKNLIHRDLKPENIFLDKNNKIKIADFGISAILNNTRYAKSFVGTTCYMAPEIVKGEKYNNKVDIWALGCIIYELCTLNRCFDAQNIYELINIIINGEHGKIDLKLYNSELQNLIDSLLNKNQKERPDIEQVYKLIIQFNKNEIELVIEINNSKVNKKIYFLGDSKPINNPISDLLYNCHDFGSDPQILKELNESNTELYINDANYKFNKFFIFNKEGIYHIKLQLNILITDCSYMFFNCYDIKQIDLSSFDTQNVTNMSWMFYGCRNLTDINLSSFDTQNVTDMSHMFCGCNNLTDINLSSFNTQNVTDMSCMYEACRELRNLDLSSFNTSKLLKMAKMFDSCSELKSINLKSFDIKNVKNMDFMFQACVKLTEIDLSSFIKIFGFFVFAGVKAKVKINKNANIDKNSFGFPSQIEIIH